jgi:acyl-homoserine lactone acylase PvdQ
MGRRAAVLVAAIVAVAIPSTASAKDYASTALNIVPSGQQGGVPVPADADRQAKMYDGLTPLFNHVTTADLFTYFKSESLGNPGPTTLDPVPNRPGLSITRDDFHVPHITGKTRDDVTFGAGWVIAEDRGLLLEQARYDSRVDAVGAPGVSGLDLITSLRSFTPSAQTERAVAKQTGVLEAAGPAGKRILHDIDVYIAGINAYLTATGSTNKPWTRNDIYAVNALKGRFVGQGGGDEARRSEFLSGLQNRLGAKRGLSAFNDLRQREDPESPITISKAFPYNSVPKDTSGNVKVDAGSLSATAARAASVAESSKQRASNILMVDGKHSTSGHPLMVAGPQIGYFYPGLTLEEEVTGPGISERGVTSLPFPGYILIGRGQDFAWTLTSADGDIIDQYAETLCRDSVHYLYKGKCLAMGNFDAGKLGAGKNQPASELTFRTTVHGPVVGYARSHGKKIAISSKRSSYGRDVLDQLFYERLAWGNIKSPQEFARAAAMTPQTFNSFYIDSKHISMFTSGLFPKRPKNVDPGLLTDGRGNEEWHGFLTPAQHPQEIDPKSGEIVNWNNKPAKAWQAADDEWGYGSLQRVLLLRRGLAKNAKQTLATITSAMNAAATQDVREELLEPTLARVLAKGTAPSPRDAQMLTLLNQWHASGSSRLDRDLDGKIDAPGAAIMDAAWTGIANAAMKPVLGSQLNEFGDIVSRFDSPPGGQFTGWHYYLYKDLRTLLGDKVQGKFANRYCGAGKLSTCAKSLWSAIDAAGNTLAAAQGADPAAWRADATAERIKFVPGLLTTTLRYTNRPTGIQQVISFSGHR